MVVLLHGFPLSRAMWEEQVAGVGSIYRVIAPDLRGPRRFARARRGYTMDEMADDVIELLDALSLDEPVVLGGLSMGGYVALSLVARYPGAGPRPDADGHPGRGRHARGGREPRGAGPGRAGGRATPGPVVEAMLPRLFAQDRPWKDGPSGSTPIRELMEQNTPAGVAGALAGMAIRPDRRGDLAAIAVPTLVLVGEDDVITPPAEAQAHGRCHPRRPARGRSPTPATSPPTRTPRSPTRVILRFLEAALSPATLRRNPPGRPDRLGEPTDSPDGPPGRGSDPMTAASGRIPDHHDAAAPRAGRPPPRDAAGSRFDTEFVSEETFEPVLCLIQVATRERLAVDRSRWRSGDLGPFWDVVNDPAVEVVMHAASEDLRICRLQTGKVPRRVFDVQIAAGLVGFGYPLSLVNLVGQVLGVSLAGGETRTDWRRRPLTPAQLRYALDDVRYLLDLADLLGAELARAGPRPTGPRPSSREFVDVDRRTGPTRSAGGGSRACTSSAAAGWRWPAGSPSGARTRPGGRTGRSARSSATTCSWRSPSASRPSPRTSRPSATSTARTS